MKRIYSTLFALTAFCGVAFADDVATSIAFYQSSPTSPALTPIVAPLYAVTFPDTQVGKTSAVTIFIQTPSSSNHTYTVNNPIVRGAAFSVGAISGTVMPQSNGFGSIVVNFSPTSAATDFASGTLQFSLKADNGLSFDYTFTLSGRVTSSRIVVSYALSSTNNQIVIQSGGTVSLPNTPVNTTTSATFTVSDTGTAPATVDSVSLTGAAYTLSGLSLLPTNLIAGGVFQFTVNFTPTAAQQYPGAVTLSVNGTVSTFTLTGIGVTSAISYETVTGTTAKPLVPGATVVFADTPADGVSKSTVSIRVSNTGNAVGTLSTINISGTDFSIANLPSLPTMLGAANATGTAPSSVLFDIVFQPSKPGPSTGRLQIGTDLFLLSGNGLGSLLTTAVDVGTGAVTVANKSTIAVPNTAVGSRRSIFIVVTNAGNHPATVSSFSVSGVGFSTPTPPALPIALAAGQSQRFEVRFAPVSTGTVTGTLAVNDQIFTLVGSGDPPPSLPAVTISGVGAMTDPLQQPSVALQIASAYTADVRGVLTLSFLSDSFSDDPAIQFANGSRTVNFTIPAGSTRANFDQLGTSAPFQTGTVSGRVVFSTSFTTGTVDITPGSAPSLTTTIPQGPPQLTSVRLGTQTDTTFELLISGYSTSRSVQQLALQLGGTTGTNLQTTAQTVDVSSAFTNWYASPLSRTFGSQFTLTLTLTVNGDPKALQSVAVTASNAKGTSAVKTVNLR